MVGRLISCYLFLIFYNREACRVGFLHREKLEAHSTKTCRPSYEVNHIPACTEPGGFNLYAPILFRLTLFRLPLVFDKLPGASRKRRLLCLRGFHRFRHSHLQRLPIQEQTSLTSFLLLEFIFPLTIKIWIAAGHREMPAAIPFLSLDFDQGTGTNLTASALVDEPELAKMVTLAVSVKAYVPTRFHWLPLSCWFTLTVASSVAPLRI